MSGRYDPSTVTLSFLIAWFVAFVAIQLAARVRATTQPHAIRWIWAGGLALGLGIWCMHFVGMLAFHLPTPLLYGIPLTAASTLPAVLASVLALYISGTRRRSIGELGVAAILMGSGICAMHYIGMAAITFSPLPGWSMPWLLASLVIAVTVSLMALLLLTRLSWDRSEARLGVHLGAAALMATGICGMHYTGMAALRLQPGSFCISRPDTIPGELLGPVVTLIVILSLAVMMLLSNRDRELAVLRALHAEDEAARSREIRELAEALATELTADLRASEDRFRALVDGSPTPTVIVEEDGKIALVNAAADRLLGYDRGELDGRPVEVLVPERLMQGHPDLRNAFMRAPREVHLGASRDLHCRHREGHEIPVELGLNPIVVQGRRMVATSIVDLTARKQAEARIRHLAYIDELTGLQNRSSCQQHLAELLANPPAGGFCLFFADLDGFKEINDALGHNVGDGILVEIAQRLRSTTGDAGTVFRFGGDEFIILLPGGNARRDEDIANQLIRQVALPLRTTGQHFVVTVSLGSARYPDDAGSSDQLLRRADNAMYHAKSAGKNLYLLYQQRMESEVTHHFLLLNDLRQAAPLGQLQLKYQPLVDMLTRDIVGAEALVYWDHPEHGQITPTTFIPVAEENGLIEALGEWVLDEAVRQASAWHRTGLPPLRMAVNVSGVQLQNRDRLHRAVEATLRRHGYPASLLELELTERQLMHDPATSIATMAALSAIGVAISLDDFGTGYSSLSYLRQFALDKIKIDRSFTEHIDHDPACLVIVRAIAEMGRGLGMQVVAEGIERETQVAPLQDCGCSEMQGYLFGRPMPAADFERTVRTWTHRMRGTPASRATVSPS
jgi:diguanylate cyclase (GGDEF)-like protein/PAS domain S-box-containing protein